MSNNGEEQLSAGASGGGATGGGGSILEEDKREVKETVADSTVQVSGGDGASGEGGGDAEVKAEVEKKKGEQGGGNEPAEELGGGNGKDDTEIAVKKEAAPKCYPPARKARNKKEAPQQQIPRSIPPELIPPNAVDITLRQTGKLWKVILDPGDENVTLLPRRGNLAKIHYKCWLATDPEKTIFDNSRLMPEDDEPVVLNIGERQVINAIDFGVGTMSKRGEKALFLAHYDFAYGKFSERSFETSNVPNGSFVFIEVELVDIEDGTMATSSGIGVRREVIQLAGVFEDERNDQESFPLTTNSLMFIKIEGYKESGEGEEEEEKEKQVFLPETVFPFTPCFKTWGFHSSGNTSYPIPRSLGDQLLALIAGDKILYTLSGDSAFEEDQVVNGVQILGREPVKFLVTVVDVEELSDPFTMSLKEKVNYCSRLLDTADDFYSNGWYEAAASKYTRVQEYLKDATRYLKTVPMNLYRAVQEHQYFALCQLAELFWHLPEMCEKYALEYCNAAVKIVEEDTISNVDKLEVYLIRSRLLREVFKEFGQAKEDLIKARELVDQYFSETHVIPEMIGAGQVAGGGVIKDNKETYAEMKRLSLKQAKILEQIKQTTELEKQQRIRSFVLKYCPPK